MPVKDWCPIQGRKVSHFAPSVPGIDFWSTPTVIRIKQLLKKNEWMRFGPLIQVTSQTTKTYRIKNPKTNLISLIKMDYHFQKRKDAKPSPVPNFDTHWFDGWEISFLFSHKISTFLSQKPFSPFTYLVFSWKYAKHLLATTYTKRSCTCYPYGQTVSPKQG